MRYDSIGFGVLAEDLVRQAARWLLLMVALPLAMLSALHTCGTFLDRMVRCALALLRHCSESGHLLCATVIFKTGCHVALGNQVLVSDALVP